MEGRADMYYDAIPGLHPEWFEDEKLVRCHLKWDIPAKLVALRGFSAAGTTWARFKSDLIAAWPRQRFPIDINLHNYRDILLR